MVGLSAAQQFQIYTELTEATSEATAEVIMQGLVDMPWEHLVTNDRLDARFAEVDARFVRLESRMDTRFAQLGGDLNARFAEVNAQIEESLRSNTFRMLTTTFAFNGALVAVIAALL